MKMFPLLALLSLLTHHLLAGVGWAQARIEGVETIDFDRPESWAMKYFTSVTLFSSMGVRELTPGSFELGFEGGFIPTLDEDQQRVGFNGTKLEDLNKTSFFGRPRLSIGLPNRFFLEVGYVPPVRVGGVKPNLFALAVGRPVALNDSWKLGLRFHSQFGTLEGDITCDAETASAGNDPARNPYNCVEPSNDAHRQRTFGGEAVAAFAPEISRLRPYIGVSFNYMDLEFQTNARVGDFLDQTLQMTDGTTVALTGGLDIAATEALSVRGELFYSWLSVTRPPSSSTANDGLFNVRFLVSYRLR